MVYHTLLSWCIKLVLIARAGAIHIPHDEIAHVAGTGVSCSVPVPRASHQTVTPRVDIRVYYTQFTVVPTWLKCTQVLRHSAEDGVRVSLDHTK